MPLSFDEFQEMIDSYNPLKEKTASSDDSIPATGAGSDVGCSEDEFLSGLDPVVVKNYKQASAELSSELKEYGDSIAAMEALILKKEASIRESMPDMELPLEDVKELQKGLKRGLLKERLMKGIAENKNLLAAAGAVAAAGGAAYGGHKYMKSRNKVEAQKTIMKKIMEKGENAMSHVKNHPVGYGAGAVALASILGLQAANRKSASMDKAASMTEAFVTGLFEEQKAAALAEEVATWEQAAFTVLSQQ